MQITNSLMALNNICDDPYLGGGTPKWRCHICKAVKTSISAPLSPNDPIVGLLLKINGSHSMTPYFCLICHPKPVFFPKFNSKLVISNDSVHNLSFKENVIQVASIELEQFSLTDQKLHSHPMTP